MSGRFISDVLMPDRPAEIAARDIAAVLTPDGDG